MRRGKIDFLITEKEAESKSETKEESQCEAEETEGEAQEIFKQEEGCWKEVTWLKTRKEVRRMNSESNLVGVMLDKFLIFNLTFFCTYF